MLLRLHNRIRSEKGEVASWLIVAAGLTAAAVAAASLLNTTIADLASSVGADTATVPGVVSDPSTSSGPTSSAPTTGESSASDPSSSTSPDDAGAASSPSDDDAVTPNADEAAAPDTEGPDEPGADGATDTEDPDEHDGRPPLGDILTDYQIADDEMVDWRPSLGGVLPAFWMDTRTLTRSEAEILDQLTVRHGILGLNTFRDVAEEAFSVSEDFYAPTPSPQDPGGVNNNHTDAFRHAYWSARLAQEFGPEFATSFTEAHEGIPGNEPSREAMDLYNNSVGIQIAVDNPSASPEELAGFINDAVVAGDLVVIDASGDLGYSDDIAIGATGHPDPADPPQPGRDPAEWDTGS